MSKDFQEQLAKRRGFSYGENSFSDRVGIDAPRVTRDEALELMCHHLALAAAYFEAAPDDLEEIISEAGRLLGNSDMPDSYASPAKIAGLQWIREMDRIFEAMEKDDE